MAAGTIYHKTALGTGEVTERKLKLPPRLRTMLILIDGVQPEFLLREEAEKVGAPPNFLEELMGKGLIEKVESASAGAAASTAPAAPAGPTDEFAKFRTAKDLMNVTIVDALGLKSFFFTLKLERAGNCADLRELMDAYSQQITKAEGAAQADVLTRRLKEILK